MSSHVELLLQEILKKLDLIIELLQRSDNQALPATTPRKGPRRKGQGWKHRPAYRAFLALSPAAKQLAVDGFREGQSTTSIVKDIKTTHGEMIPEPSLNRYREWWEVTELPHKR